MMIPGYFKPRKQQLGYCRHSFHDFSAIMLGSFNATSASAPILSSSLSLNGQMSYFLNPQNSICLYWPRFSQPRLIAGGWAKLFFAKAWIFILYDRKMSILLFPGRCLCHGNQNQVTLCSVVFIGDLIKSNSHISPPPTPPFFLFWSRAGFYPQIAFQR